MNAVCACWDSMRSAQLLSGMCLAESHLVSDVICFVAFVKKWRGRCRQARLSVAAVPWLSHLRRGIVQWLAHGMDHYTIHEYPKIHKVD